MTTNGGSAAYSRFAEEMDIDTPEFKFRGESYGQGSWGAFKTWCGYNRKTLGVVALCLGMFLIGVVIGHYLHFGVAEHCDVRRPNMNHTATSAPPTEPPPASNYSNMVHTLIDKSTLDTYLKRFTERPHYAASPDSAKIASDIKNAWSAQGFHVYTKQYNVQLSRPNMTKPNKMETYGLPSVCCNTTYYPNDTSDHSMLSGFSPYSTNVELESELVYINYGRNRDFIKLRDVAHISVKNHTCLVRMGQISIRHMIRNCKDHGGIALVVFPDALRYAPNISKETDPKTWWLPVDAIIREPVRMAFGDPLTPFLPSLEYGTYNGSTGSPETEGITADMDMVLNFPTQVIGYEQARKYLTTMQHPVAPADWQGIKLGNHTFSVGPGFATQSRKFKMTINNVLTTEKITNVFGVMKGEIEPDRYVIIGNHRDSLTHGGVDPGTGTACLMELSRVLGALYSQGWRPRRTVMLVSWDAGDDGQIGAAEWVEENVEVLRERAVAYINLDGAVEGNYTFSAAGSPLLKQIMYYATRRVQCPDAAHENMKVYANWAQKKPGISGAEIEPLGLRNDAAPFLHIAGVPSVNLKYTYDKAFYNDLPTYPARHTAYDTYDYVKRFIDPDMSIHAAVTEVVAEAVLSLADDPLLNIQVVNYADALVEYYRDLRQNNETNFGPKNSLIYLNEVIQRFAAAAQDFQQKHYIPPDMNNPTMLREINDRVMSIDRAMTGDPGRFYLPQLRHVVYGPSRDGYEGAGFAPLRQAMGYYGRRNDDWSSVRPALSATISRIEAAVHLLTESPLQSDESLTKEGSRAR